MFRIFFLFHIAKSYAFIYFSCTISADTRITTNTINDEQIIVIDVWSAIDQKTHVSMKTKWNDLNNIYYINLF